MSGDFYPDDTDENHPQDNPLFWTLGFLVLLALLYLAFALCYWVFAWVLNPITTPAGSCVAPVCAAFLFPHHAR